jgi:hypothetical protein
MSAGSSGYPRDAGRPLDALGESRKLVIEMKIHFDMLRNYFWYTD